MVGMNGANKQQLGEREREKKTRERRETGEKLEIILQTFCCTNISLSSHMPDNVVQLLGLTELVRNVSAAAASYQHSKA